MSDAQRQQQKQRQLSRLDQQLLELARQLVPAAQRKLIRRFVCGAVAQSAEQRALNPSIMVRTHAAQVGVMSDE